MTTCLPGASVLGTPTADHVEIKLRIKVGPIVAEFEGSADVVRDPQNCSGTIRGSARDIRSSSATRGEIRYVLLEEKGGAATRVDVDVGFTLTGALAQFSRSSIVQDIAKRMTAAFAQNLEARLNQRDIGHAQLTLQRRSSTRGRSSSPSSGTASRISFALSRDAEREAPARPDAAGASL